MFKNSLHCLKDIFGFPSFRPNQEELISGLLSGRDVFGVMPTGGGKSLCYQVPAVMINGCAIVVSPLIALMKDQVDSASALGIKAGCLTSHSHSAERKAVMHAYQSDELDLLYVAPERLSQPPFHEFLRSHPHGKPSFFAIDEAHCLSEWGHDFRPDYLFLTRLKSLFPDSPVAAFTATATPQVSHDISEKLQLSNPISIRASFDRKNLFYEIRARSDAEEQLIQFLKDQGEHKNGIIYRTTRKSVEETADMLRRNGYSAQAYHAGLDPQERNRIQEDFINDRVPLIVATVAFGMGIDKPDVRFVIHYDLPKTVEGYYQETGRAGRDGDPSHCLLLYSPADVAKQGYLIDQCEDLEEKRRNWALLRQMDRYAANPSCRRRELLRYFGEEYTQENCDSCDYCKGSFKEVNATYEARVILSAIARTQGRFGATHLCDIVTGANTQRIRDLKHNELKTYGLGKANGKKYWRSLIDGLIVGQYLIISEGQFPVPQMTPEGRALMKGVREFHLKEDLRIEPSKAQALNNDPDYDHGLFEALRRLRLQLSEKEGVPPYVIFSDRTLRQIAGYQPKNETELAQLHGVGKAKVERYATPFLQELSNYIEQTPNVKEAVASLPSTVSSPTIKKGISNTYAETLKLFQNGKSLSEIANLRDYTESTILGHLCKLHEAGEDINLLSFLSKSEASEARFLLTEHGTTSLKPAFEAGEGKIPYSTLRVIATLMEKE